MTEKQQLLGKGGKVWNEKRYFFRNAVGNTSLSKKIVKSLSNYISTKISRFKTRMFLFDHARLANGDTQNSHDWRYVVIQTIYTQSSNNLSCKSRLYDVSSFEMFFTGY